MNPRYRRRLGAHLERLWVFALIDNANVGADFLVWLERDLPLCRCAGDAEQHCTSCERDREGRLHRDTTGACVSFRNGVSVPVTEKSPLIID